MQQDLFSPSDNWPPPYTIRRSQKAKRIHLRISHATGLEVVVPNWRKQVDIATILDTRRNWIEKHLHLLESPKQSANHSATKCPSILALNAVQEIWHVSYVSANNKVKLIEKANHSLTCYGVLQPHLMQGLLIDWLKNYAAKRGLTKLTQISQKTGLEFRQLGIRNQKTIWGSCNAHKNISLNFKILFLPPAIFNYVLLHELCHTKHLNHSKKFWQLVAKFDSNYLANDQTLKHGDQFVPDWVLHF